MRVPVHFLHKILHLQNIIMFHFVASVVTGKPHHSTKCYKQKITDSTIDQVSVALMVSADTCAQVVQGSNPTGGWKVIGSATAFSAVAFKMILRAPVRVPVDFFHKIL